MPKFSVKKPFTVIVAVILVIILGAISFMNMTTDLFPSLELPYVIVMTTYPGASPEKVEKAVTKPLEQSLATTGGIKNITSISQENASIVILEFNDGTNMDSAMIEMSGYIDLVKGNFDDIVASPMLMKLNPDMLPIMVASVDVNDMDAIEISTYAQDEIIPQIERISGVASVSASGIIENRIEITIDQEKIDVLNQIMLDSIDKTLGDANRELKNATAKIKEGKDTLESESKTGIDKLADGSAMVDSAVASLNALLAEETTLETQQKAFEGEKTAMQGVQVQYTQLNAGLAAMGTSAETLVALPVDQFADFIAAIPDVPQTATIKALTQEMLTQLIGANTLAQTRIPEIDTELRNISTRVMTINAMKPTLQANLDKAVAGYKELEGGKLAMGTGLSSAQTQLSIAQNELDKAQKEFETQRDTALEAANLDGVLTQDMVSKLLMAQNFSMPAGYITEGEDKYIVKIGDEINTISDLEKLPLLSIDIEGLRDIKLCDVANIKTTNNVGESYAKINGNDGILLTIQKQSTFSTANVCNDIKGFIKDLQKQNPDIHITPLMDQGVYIDIVIQSVLSNLLLGGLLAIVVLLVFLRDIASTLIIGFSIPISVMFAIVLMYFSGVTLNIVSLSGLALGVGMLVDNSIVSIENIYRMHAMGLSRHKAAVEGAKQISSAIFASTLTTVCVFLPIVFTQGLTRQIFTDMGLTIAYSLIASLIVALTVVPTMSSMLLKKSHEKPHKLFDKFKEKYARSLDWVLGHKALVLVAVCALFVYSIVSIGFMGTEFIPTTEGTQISATLEMPKGSLHEDLITTSDTFIERISDIEDIDTIGAMSGGGGTMLSMGGGSANSMSYYILLSENKKQSTTEIAEMIIERTGDLDCTIYIQTSNMDMTMLGGSGIEVEIKGKDLDVLQTTVNRLAAELAKVEGVASANTSNTDASAETYVTVNKTLATKHGLTVAQVYSQIADALQGEKTATTLSTASEDYPVVIINDKSENIDRKNLANLEIILPETQGAAMPNTDDKKKTSVLLSEIAEVGEVAGRNSISHDNQSRVMTVKVEISEDYNVGLVGRDVDKVLASFQTPDGYSLLEKGENENINEALYNLILMIALAVVFIYMIMVAQFQSLLSPFIVMFTMPLAFTGGLLALQITGSTLSMLSMLGFLVLAGIVVNNGIVFIDYVNQLRLEGMDKRTALLTAGRDRIRPILMTAITTILGLSTMALGLGTGADMMQPMAIVTIGGLTYATVLTLYIVPCIYDIMHKKTIKKIDTGEE